MGSIIPRSIKSNMYSLNRGTGQGDFSNSVNYGRVIDVIMDSSHPEWERLGGTQAQYGVFFQKPYSNDPEENVPEYNFAFCGNPNLRRIPVKNEIVSIKMEIRSDVSEDLEKRECVRMYWEDIIPVWNSPHLNAYPDTIAHGEGAVDVGKDFKESGDVKPLQLCAGDVSLEGRHGNSIRLGGTKKEGSPISTSDVNGNPYMILRVGQASSSEDAVYEDINKDLSSIYLVSDHKVELTQAAKKRKAWKSGKGPKEVKDYQGAQIVANTNRIVLNARENDIELIAKEEIGATGKLIALDGDEYVAFDAAKIYLGKSAFNEFDPVLLGQKTVDWLSNLCTSLNTLLTTMGTTTTPAQLPALAATAQVIKTQITGYKSTLPNLKSKKSFVE